MKDIEYTEYTENKNKIPWIRVIVSLLIIVLIVIIILLCLKSCTKPSLKDDIISAAKEYYKINPSELPSEIATCKQLTLNELEVAKLIDSEDYDSCDRTGTYVNVCYLESKNYHYSAILACDEVINYGMWQNGTENDLKEDSDVRFNYLGELKNTGSKYYYPNDLTLEEEVNEYYLNPIGEYNIKGSTAIGYKWYVNKSVNEYYNNGEYKSVEPSGYSNKGKEKEVTSYSIVKPNSYTYRTITETTLYRKQLVARPYIYFCNTSLDATTAPIQSPNPCSGDTPVVVEMLYTCDGTTNVQRGTVCEDFSEWTNEKCTKSVLNGINCEESKGYKYTDKMWQWYKKTTKKEYYPSGKSNASEEITYYVTSPVSSAIKDESTSASVSKYYKIVNDNGSFIDWEQITDGYVTFEELIEAFKNKQFEVNSLKDIDDIDNIRYQYQLQYRNVE